jgi:hypothetical protein
VEDQGGPLSKRRRIEKKGTLYPIQPHTRRVGKRTTPSENAAGDKDGHPLEVTEAEQSVSVQPQPTPRQRHARSPRVVVTRRRTPIADYEYVPPSNSQARVNIQEDNRSDEEPDGIAIAPDDHDPSFGQREELTAVFQAIKHYKKAEAREEFYTPEYREENILEPISELCKACNRCEDALNGMREAQGDTQGMLELELHSALGEMRQLLNDVDPDRHPDSAERKEYAIQVYLYVFPGLVAVLKATIEYLTVIYQDHNDSHLDKLYLRFLMDILSLIVNLGNQAPKWKTRPAVRNKGDVAFIKPIAHGVVVPLRKILSALRREYNRIIEDEEHEQVLAERERRRQVWVEKQRIEALRQEREDELRRRLCTIYLWRKSAEPNRRLWIVHDMPPQLSRRHQRVEPQLEVDANGREFERMPLFRAREHPPHNPDLEEWTLPEREALAEALLDNHGKILLSSLQPT